MELLERSRPKGDTVLIIYATFTRFGIGEPHFTPDLFREAQPPDHVQVLNVNTNGELALVTLAVSVVPEWSVELAVAYATLKYGRALGTQMFGEEHTKQISATRIASFFNKAQWQGTQDWDFVRFDSDQFAPPPILN